GGSCKRDITGTMSSCTCRLANRRPRRSCSCEHSETHSYPLAWLSNSMSAALCWFGPRAPRAERWVAAGRGLRIALTSRTSGSPCPPWRLSLETQADFEESFSRRRASRHRVDIRSTGTRGSYDHRYQPHTHPTAAVPHG